VLAGGPGDLVALVSRVGETTLRAHITDRMQPGFAADFALHGAQLFGPHCRVEDPRFVRAGWFTVLHGETIHYDLTVTNTGTIAFPEADVEVTDANCDAPPVPSTERQDLSAPPPPCTVRIVMAIMRADKQERLGDLIEGNTSMDRFAVALGVSAWRAVINKTGLSAAIGSR